MAIGCYSAVPLSELQRFKMHPAALQGDIYSRKAQLYANVPKRNVSDNQARANQAHFNVHRNRNTVVYYSTSEEGIPSSADIRPISLASLGAIIKTFSTMHTINVILYSGNNLYNKKWTTSSCALRGPHQSKAAPVRGEYVNSILSATHTELQLYEMPKTVYCVPMCRNTV